MRNSPTTLTDYIEYTKNARPAKRQTAWSAKQATVQAAASAFDEYAADEQAAATPISQARALAHILNQPA